MPQPALHILLARQTLERWGSSPHAPFDVHDDGAVNAFMHGSLAPDMGNFPGGSRALARLVHTRRTGGVQRVLLERAATQEEHAFALGWLAHIIADVLVHPLVNEDAERRRQPGAAQIVEHVRVEVGLDVWFCWQHAALRGIRLRPAFDRTAYGFLADTLNSVIDAGVTTEQLTRMERGLIMFSHGALHFATTVARRLSWRDDLTVTVPLGSALVWHTASRLSPVNSVVNAYLNPHIPEPRLIGRVESALRSFDGMLDAAVADGARSLPDYDLEDGTIRTDQRVA
ncbi:MAG TPA: zinc dependent phospholipase C family protein [Longimicrobiales bacterium]|nr:zinc dependent phospholipase C family protein [Longimicrobiales bacterium]